MQLLFIFHNIDYERRNQNLVWKMDIDRALTSKCINEAEMKVEAQ